MMTFSSDPTRAEQQMHAIIFYLTTFGYIDGDFDSSEKSFVREYIGKLVRHRVETGAADADAKLKAELTAKFTQHFHEVFEGIDRNVKVLFTEAVSKDEEQDQFVHTKLKVRCFEILKGFDRPSQESLLETIDELIHADGEVHPAEVKFRGEIASLLEADLGIQIEEEGFERPQVRVSVPDAVGPKTTVDKHPFFDQFEFHYSSNPAKIQKQLAADLALVDRTIATIEALGAPGKGKLDGKRTVADLAGTEPFLDGHVYSLAPVAGRSYDLTVLGDLHGCYSCLKAAILQSRFFEKVAAFEKEPANNPEAKLVLLGDYIDRGMFSYNGVLRTVMQLYATAPKHVYMLRGNHEFYLEYKGNIYGGVKPAEAINTLKPHASLEVFQHYLRLFDALPNMLLFDRVLFVHGGIPRDRLIKERWKDLSTLNDPDIRFQMMWSDPSSADVIPAELQDQSARFAFGRLQAHAFLHRIGCHTLVRGHEKVDGGFERVYDDGAIVLMTLFSAGGATNDDLPADSAYRTVTPMAMTMTLKDGALDIVPWAIDYERYNDPARNAFFKMPPEIEHKME